MSDIHKKGKQFLSYAERKELESKNRLENNKRVRYSYNLVKGPPLPMVPPPPPVYPYPQPTLSPLQAQILCFFTRQDVTDKYK